MALPRYIQAWFTAEHREQIQLHALREGLRPADIVRRATIQWLAANPLRPAPKPQVIDLFSDQEDAS